MSFPLRGCPRPHFIVRRYAEFSSALLLLNEGAGFEEIVSALESLRQEGSYRAIRTGINLDGATGCLACYYCLFWGR